MAAEKERRPPRPWTENQARVAAVLLPLSGVLIALKLTKIVLRPECFGTRGPLSFTNLVGLLSSDLFLLAAILVLFCGALVACATSRQRSWVQAALQAVSVVVVVVDVVAAEYFLKTEGALDFPLVAAKLEQPADVSTLIVGSATISDWLVLVVSLGAIVIVPGYVTRAWKKAEHFALQPATRRRRAVAGFVICLGCVPLAMLGLAPSGGADRSLLRDPVLNLVATALGDVEREAPARTSLDGRSIERARAARFEISIERVDSRPLRNVVVIVLESTRAKSVGAYSPGLATTPFFDDLARRSLKVDRAYTVVPSTAKALRAIFCGSEPSHGPRLPTAEPGSTNGCLPRHLSAKGYDTVFFSSQSETFELLGEEAKMLGFTEGYYPENIDTTGFEKANYVGYEDDVMLKPSRQWLAAHKQRPFFAGYLTGAPHHGGRAPSVRHGTVVFSDDPNLNRFENCIRQEDLFLRALFEQYRDLSLYEDTLFVIVGDHGEAFGEHGRHTHVDVPWEEGLRVPMIFHDPRGTAFRSSVVTGPANQLDIMPSLLDALGFRMTHGTLAGASINHLPKDRAVMAACLDRRWCLARIEAREKLIFHFGHLPDEFFDLSRDPGETVNLASSQPEKVRRWKDELLAWDQRVWDLYWQPAPSP
jgi:lipoteichoic acid synthase